MPSLTRPIRGRIIAGVCAGIANRFNISPFLVRLLFVLSLLLPGPQILIYLAMWIIVPNERA
ncbi:PspC domain-containing protein [Naasia sp. SYSU D00057]|uniref:PspC domain-containing protein n=1 Tax=Naasia sp. SYSU D00057 TaxID=2817380 RepID=UPI001B3022A0|nr:PspC domain-containing protein [Naasia sp. SYSU D00057]